ncbi:hypothetical protein BJ165DRAFT_1447728, partial [Panaeolus papilionaceus]
MNGTAGNNERGIGIGHASVNVNVNVNATGNTTMTMGQGTTNGYDASPFYFSPPELSTTSPVTAANPRKRPFDHDDGPPRGPTRPSTSNAYDYCSESRPQSRRLSVMELCNDEPERPATGTVDRERERFTPGSGSFLLSAATSRGPPPIATSSSSGSAAGGGYSSRPTTSSGLVNSAKALHLFDIDDDNRPTSRDGPSSAQPFAFTPPSLPAPSLSTANPLVSSAGSALLARTGLTAGPAVGAGAHGDEARQSSPVTPSTTGPASPREYSNSPPARFRFAYGVGGRVDQHPRERQWSYGDDDDDDDEDRQSESPRFGFRVSGEHSGASTPLLQQFPPLQRHQPHQMLGYQRRQPLPPSPLGPGAQLQQQQEA